MSPLSSEADDVARKEPRPWLLAALMVTVVVGASSRAFDGPFLYDDTPLILENDAVRDGRSPAGWLREPFWERGPLGRESKGLYRPVSLISLRVDRLVHGENPSGFHATNILLHGLNSLLLFSVARRFGVSAIPAALGAASWAILPRLTECSAWISGRTDMLALFFCLLAFLSWPWGHDAEPRRRDWFRVVSASIALFLAMLSKEVAFAAAAAILAAELSARPRRWTRLAVRAAPVLAALGLCGALRVLAVGRIQGAVEPLAFSTRALRFFASAGTYLRMLFDPLRPSAQIGFIERILWVDLVGGAVLLVALGVCAVWTWRRSNNAERAVAVCWLGSLSFLAVLHLVPIQANVMAADRYLYVPTAALALGLMMMAKSLRGRWAVAVATGALLWVGVGAIATWSRIGVWNDPLLFWVDASEKADPENFIPLGELGVVLQSDGFFVESESLQRAVLRSIEGRFGSGSSLYRVAQGNLAETYAARGEYDRAARMWSDVLARSPELGFVWLRLGRVEAWREKWEAASESTERAMQAGSVNPGAVERQRALIPVWKEISASLPDASRAALDRSAAVARARGLTLLRRTHEAAAQWRVVLDTGSDPQLLVEALRFYAQDGASSEARTALGFLERSGLCDEQAEALHEVLRRKASAAERVQAILPRIRGLAAMRAANERDNRAPADR